MANKSQDAKRAASKRAPRTAGTSFKKAQQTEYQKERDALKNGPKRKHRNHL